jgi:para-aminobenzoate synthetase / 4-amino-4-deoxychorismate lyase
MMNTNKTINSLNKSVYCEINFPALPTISTDERFKAVFDSPIAIHVATAIEEVKTVLASVEAARLRGHWCVGFVAHEAAGAFDRALVVKTVTAKQTPTPLAWFAEFVKPASDMDEATGEFSVGEWQRDTDAAQFAKAVESIRADIHEGRFYQVNFTTRLEATFAGDARQFFRALQVAQPNGYHLYIDAGDFQLLSVSPELFFAIRENVITTQPMKGTAPRGDTPSEDASIAAALTHSPKERAENLMIVDLLRNDLSRIAIANSVEVPHLFSLHPLPSVWQMTSTVRASLSKDKTLTDIFSALFPCGSVTGAPKVEAMKAIAALEHQPRGVYCGALGFVAPDGVAAFNVGIRSVWIADGRASCGIGSGITYDSTVEGEAAEVAYKARFVTRASEPFQLFETMRMENGAIKLLSRHLARLDNSARHFRFNVNSESLYSAATLSLNAVKMSALIGVWRIKLTLNSQGECHAERFVLDETPDSPMIQFAKSPISRHDEFVQHKTTRRQVYDQHAPLDGVWDTLLFNEENEITEFIRANIVLDIDGQRVTPPVACGLLNGTLREQLLAGGDIIERVLTRRDVERADNIWWVNGLRGEILVTVAT